MPQIVSDCIRGYNSSSRPTSGGTDAVPPMPTSATALASIPSPPSALVASRTIAMRPPTPIPMSMMPNPSELKHHLHHRVAAGIGSRHRAPSNHAHQQPQQHPLHSHQDRSRYELQFDEDDNDDALDAVSDHHHELDAEHHHHHRHHHYHHHSLHSEEGIRSTDQQGNHDADEDDLLLSRRARSPASVPMPILGASPSSSTASMMRPSRAIAVPDLSPTHHQHHHHQHHQLHAQNSGVANVANANSTSSATYALLLDEHQHHQQQQQSHQVPSAIASAVVRVIVASRLDPRAQSHLATDLDDAIDEDVAEWVQAQRKAAAAASKSAKSKPSASSTSKQRAKRPRSKSSAPPSSTGVSVAHHSSTASNGETASPSTSMPSNARTQLDAARQPHHDSDEEQDDEQAPRSRHRRTSFEPGHPEWCPTRKCKYQIDIYSCYEGEPPSSAPAATAAASISSPAATATLSPTSDAADHGWIATSLPNLLTSPTLYSSSMPNLSSSSSSLASTVTMAPRAAMSPSTSDLTQLASPPTSPLSLSALPATPISSSTAAAANTTSPISPLLGALSSLYKRTTKHRSPHQATEPTTPSSTAPMVTIPDTSLIPMSPPKPLPIFAASPSLQSAPLSISTRRLASLAASPSDVSTGDDLTQSRGASNYVHLLLESWILTVKPLSEDRNNAAAPGSRYLVVDDLLEGIEHVAYDLPLATYHKHTERHAPPLFGADEAMPDAAVDATTRSHGLDHDESENVSGRFYGMPKNHSTVCPVRVETSDMREVVLPDLVIDNVCYSLLVIYKRRVNRLPLKKASDRSCRIVVEAPFTRSFVDCHSHSQAKQLSPIAAPPVHRTLASPIPRAPSAVAARSLEEVTNSAAYGLGAMSMPSLVQPSSCGATVKALCSHIRTQPRRAHEHGYSTEAIDEIGPFVGSFHESLLSGRMSSVPSTVYPGFKADVLVAGGSIRGRHGGSLPRGMEQAGKHLRVPFNATCYHTDSTAPAPYVATIDLANVRYRIPPKGVIAVTIINPTTTPIKTFMMMYDFSDMPDNTKTFLRQKIVSSTAPSILVYAMQVHATTKKGRVYLCKCLRVVFPYRLPDETGQLTTTYESPDNPKYFAL